MSPEEGTATHSSIPAWRIPWTEEPGELRSIRSHSQTQLKRLNTHAQNTYEPPRMFLLVCVLSHSIMSDCL